MNTYMHTDDDIEPEVNPLEVVGGLLSDKYLERFRVFNAKTLFPPNFELLQKNLCPICGRKLYLTRNKKIAYCKSKKKDKFIITSQRLLSLGGKMGC